jgi:hypothetical protein
MVNTQDQKRKSCSASNSTRIFVSKKTFRSKRSLPKSENIKANKIRITRKSSMGKILLVAIPLKTYDSHIEELTLMKMYKSVIAPKFKTMNQERVERVTLSVQRSKYTPVACNKDKYI